MHFFKGKKLKNKSVCYQYALYLGLFEDYMTRGSKSWCPLRRTMNKSLVLEVVKLLCNFDI